MQNGPTKLVGEGDRKPMSLAEKNWGGAPASGARLNQVLYSLSDSVAALRGHNEDFRRMLDDLLGNDNQQLVGYVEKSASGATVPAIEGEVERLADALLEYQSLVHRLAELASTIVEPMLMTQHHHTA